MAGRGAPRGASPRAFIAAYDDLIRRARQNELTLADFQDTTVTVTNPGMGYTAAPAVTITGTTGSGFAGTGNLGFRVTGFTVTGGSGYTSAPAVAVAAPPTSNCVPTM